LQANVAKLESSMTFSGDKLDLKIYGFNEKLPVLASKIANLLTTLVPKEHRFQVIIEPTVCFLLFLRSFRVHGLFTVQSCITPGAT
jgi:hypothetical protein